MCCWQIQALHSPSSAVKTQIAYKTRSTLLRYLVFSSHGAGHLSQKHIQYQARIKWPAKLECLSFFSSFVFSQMQQIIPNQIIL